MQCFHANVFFFIIEVIEISSKTKSVQFKILWSYDFMSLWSFGGPLVSWAQQSPKTRQQILWNLPWLSTISAWILEIGHGITILNWNILAVIKKRVNCIGNQYGLGKLNSLKIYGITPKKSLFSGSCIPIDHFFMNFLLHLFDPFIFFLGNAIKDEPFSSLVGRLVGIMEK